MLQIMAEKLGINLMKDGYRVLIEAFIKLNKDALEYQKELNEWEKKL